MFLWYNNTVITFLPINPKKENTMRADIKEFLEQIRISNERIKGEQEQVKAIKDAMQEKTGLEKKVIATLAKIYCSDKGSEELALYETVSGLLD